MDHNKHTYDGPLGRALLDPGGLALQGGSAAAHRKEDRCYLLPRKIPINGLWVTSNIEVANACVMPFGYGIGDHQMFILDITMESFVGKNPTKAVRPVSCRLNSKMPQCGKAYVQSLEQNIVQHRLLERLNKVNHISLSHEKGRQRS